jgi:hypothetical protein
LLKIGVDGKERTGMLGEMVGAVVFPEAANIMHEAVIDVEPKVEHDAVEANLEG